MIEQLRERAYERGVTTALVRGERASPRPPGTVSVAPEVTARLGPTRKHGALCVTTDGPDGRTVRRYERADARAAVGRVAAVTTDCDPTAVWLCDRERIAAWWSEGAAERLEKGLAEATSETDAPLVVWTSERNGAVGDRYDVVVEP